jgi:hypothetical protein
MKFPILFVTLSLVCGIGKISAVPLYWVGQSLTQAQTAELVKARPFLLGSSSRKPIGICYLCFNQGTAGNPGGLGVSEMNLTKPAGLTALSAYLTSMADTIISNLSACHAQGVIVWDFDGNPSQGGWPSYIGAPNVMMQADGGWWPAGVLTAYQAFVSRIQAAGFTVGCCLRCDTVIVQNGVPMNNTNPQLGSNQLFYPDTDTAKANLLAKCSWAVKNLGCTMFYWDSYNLANGMPAYDQFLPAYIMKQLPQVTLISCEEGSTLQPPQEYINSFSDSPLYCPLPAAGSPWSVVPLDPTILAAYPSAFKCVNVDEGTGITGSNYSTLFTAFQAKQALPLFQSWWSAPSIPYLKQMVAAGLWP